jgi:hypothetical protein
LETAQQTINFRSGQTYRFRETLRRQTFSDEILQANDLIPIGAKKDPGTPSRMPE